MSSITWFFNRLRGMSFPELGYRLHQQLLRFGEQFGWHQPIPVDVAAVDLNLFSEHPPDLGFIEKNSGLKAEILRRAENSCQHRFKIFSAPEVCLGSPIDWQRDFQTGNRWPLKFYGKLSYRSRAAGSSKWIMELNRHTHFFWLGQAYLLTRQKKYAHEILNQMQGWVDQNPYLRGIHWYSGLEMALRLIAWSWALNCLEPELGDKKAFSGIFQALLNQAQFIFRHRVKYSSANNHLIGEATGLLVASFLFPKQSTGWRETALQILETEIEKQILPDGMSAEQSTHYLGFVLEFYLVAGIILCRRQQELPEKILSRLTRAAELLHPLRDANGTLPVIGDGDDSFVFFQNVAFSHFDSMLNGIGILTGKRELCAGNWPNDLKSFFWLGWHPNHTRFQKLPSQPYKPPGSRLLAESGYALLESTARGKQRLMFDCGPLGMPPLCAHGHADALSIQLVLENTPVLIDPGTYNYYDQLTWKNYFRGTSAHNTICVDRQDQSEIASYFVWRNQAPTKICHWQTAANFDWVIAEQTGYQRLRQPVIHRRHIFYLRDHYWIVSDQLFGHGQHIFEQNFHFAPEGRLRRQNEIFIWENTTTQLRLAPVWGNDLNLQIHEGCLNPIRGWISPAFHQKIPGQTLTISKTANCPTQMGAVLWPGKMPAIVKASTPDVQLLRGKDLSQILALEITTTAGTDYFIRTDSATDKIRFGNFEFEGALLWVSLAPNNQITRLIAINAVRLKNLQTEIFSFQENQPVFTSGFEQEQRA
jgi:hypothetical protein